MFLVKGVHPVIPLGKFGLDLSSEAGGLLVVGSFASSMGEIGSVPPPGVDFGLTQGIAPRSGGGGLKPALTERTWDRDAARAANGLDAPHQNREEL